MNNKKSNGNGNGKKLGVLKSIVDVLEKASNPLDRKEIIKRMERRFPDRPLIGNTVKVQLSLKAPKTRLEREQKGIKVIRSKDGKFSIKKKNGNGKA